MNYISKELFTSEIWSISDQIKKLEKELNEYLLDIDIEQKKIIGEGHDIIRIISSILSHSARLNKLFQADAQMRGESDIEYKNRCIRADFLRNNIYSGKKLQPLLNSKVRNIIEHYDSILDNIQYRINEINHLSICANMVLYSKNVFKNNGWERILPLKVYVYDESNFYITDKNLQKIKVDMKKLFKANDILLNKLITICNSNGEKSGPGGILKFHPHSIKNN